MKQKRKKINKRNTKEKRYRKRRLEGWAGTRSEKE